MLGFGVQNALLDQKQPASYLAATRVEQRPPSPSKPMPNPESVKSDDPHGTPCRRQVIKRVAKRVACSGGRVHIEYEDAILPEDLPLHMRMGTAVAFLAQHLDASPATLYRVGIAARIPVVYLKTRRLRDGTVKPSDMRVTREGLLRLLEDIISGTLPADD